MSKRKNNLIIIENGRISTCILDEKPMWEIGRPSKERKPDICLRATTVSRKHGRLENVDGIWFYLDYNGKNGTVYNGKHVVAGRNGRTKPIMLSDGDVLIFGGGEQAVINHKTIWTMFMTRYYEAPWQVVDTKDMKKIVVNDGEETQCFENPEKGLVVATQKGIGIYMGDITYLSGDIYVVGK